MTIYACTRCGNLAAYPPFFYWLAVGCPRCHAVTPYGCVPQAATVQRPPSFSNSP